MKLKKEKAGVVWSRPLTVPSQAVEAKALEPEQIWSLLNRQQQQVVFQTLVQVCQHLGQNGCREVGDEPK